MADKTLPELYTDNPVLIDPGDLGYIVENTGTTPAEGAYKLSQLMFNRYKISVTVSSNDLIVALKHEDGTDPSADRPLYFKIGDSLRACTAALSKTLADGTSWFGSGSTVLGTKEVDYFVYVIWNTTPATDIMDLGFARKPYFNRFAAASATTTSEDYMATANASAPAATDEMTNIARFAATLSLVGTGHLWTVPTFTINTLVNRPTFETRLLSFTQVFSNFTVGSATVYGQYRIMGPRCAGRGGAVLSSSTMGTAPSFTLPVTPSDLGTTYENIGDIVLRDTGTALFEGTLNYVSGNTAYLNYKKVNGTAIETAAVAATVPMTWANTDEFSYNFLFEMA